MTCLRLSFWLRRIEICSILRKINFLANKKTSLFPFKGREAPDISSFCCSPLFHRPPSQEGSFKRRQILLKVWVCYAGWSLWPKMSETQLVKERNVYFHGSGLISQCLMILWVLNLSQLSIYLFMCKLFMMKRFLFSISFFARVKQIFNNL